MLRSSPSIKILATPLWQAYTRMIATKLAGHMQVGGWISRWSRWPPVLYVLYISCFPLALFQVTRGKMSRKIRFYCVFSTLGFLTGEFPQHFKKIPL